MHLKAGGEEEGEEEERGFRESGWGRRRDRVEEEVVGCCSGYVL